MKKRESFDGNCHTFHKYVYGTREKCLIMEKEGGVNMIRILFVCTGNTCRSPMAEAILKNKEIPGIEVKSAGVYATNGSAASRNATQVLKEQNINHEHQSLMLTEELLSWATYIFTMTKSHKSSVIGMYPFAKGKTFTLKEFVEQDGDIVDPYGGSVEDYRLTYYELHTNIEKLILRLENAGTNEGG